MMSRPVLPLLAVLLLTAGSAALSADPAPLPETVSRIERETGARVLSAQRSTRGGREVNRIKLITPEGRVRIMWDDPHRGRTMGSPQFAPRPVERNRFPATDSSRPMDRATPTTPARDDG
jgi:hypothetical protein